MAPPLPPLAGPTPPPPGGGGPPPGGGPVPPGAPPGPMGGTGAATAPRPMMGSGTAGLVLVHSAMEQLQKALLGLPMGSELHTAVLKAITEISRRMEPGGASASEKIQALSATARDTAANPQAAALQRMFQTQAPGGPGAPSAPGAGAGPAAPPQAA